MRKGADTPKTLFEATSMFADEACAFKYIVSRRWPNGVACPHCGCLENTFVKTRRIWRCKGCAQQFSVRVGTIFEDSPIRLGKWLFAMWMVANCKNGVSSYEIARSIGVTQKTAWFMLHRIRQAMQSGTFEKLKGKVEADETYIGGKARNMHFKKKKDRISKGSKCGKAIVLGMLERGGRVHTEVIQRTDRKTIKKAVLKRVDGHASLFTDAHSGYDELNFHYSRYVIDHANSYVEGNIHTNGIECYWSLLKRTIKGTYVSVEPFHLFRYLGEQAFRFNNRDKGDGDRLEEVLGGMWGRRLTYTQLIGRAAAGASA